MKALVLLLPLFISTQSMAHFFDSPYECLSTHTSKRSGKVHTTLSYFHPSKNWMIKLSGVKKNSPFKVANLYTPEGRYDGTYKGVYPAINEVKFGTYWPYKKAREVKLSSKISKSNCSLLKNKTVFDLPNLGTLECMDPKGLGTCKAINR
ncbi:MAG: hypothetical protein ACJAT2_002167 [Bacteriovoracaceae bacterium]|jgi:hypothetical protein